MKAETILCWLACAAMIASLLICMFMGGCSSMVETVMGNQVPMKCHWAFNAGALVSALGTIGAFAAAIVKKPELRKAYLILTIIDAIAVVACNATPIIGICAKAGMHCHTTAMFVNIVCVVAVVMALVAVLLGNKSSKPKMSL